MLLAALAGCTVVGFETPYNKGVDAYREGRFGAALEHFTTAIEQHADRYEAYFNLGLTYEALERTDKAIAAYEQCLKAKPDNARALINLGWIHYEAGERGRARSLFERAVAAETIRGYPLSTLGNFYEREGQFTLAGELYDKAYAREPKSPIVLYRRGAWHLGQAKRLSSASAVASASGSPSSVERRTPEIVAHLNAARADFQAATEADPEDAPSFERLGEVAEALGKQREAVAAYATALSLSEGRADLAVRLAALYQALAEKNPRYHERAIEYLWEARRMDPEAAGVSEALLLSYEALVRRERRRPRSPSETPAEGASPSPASSSAGP